MKTVYSYETPSGYFIFTFIANTNESNTQQFVFNSLSASLVLKDSVFAGLEYGTIYFLPELDIKDREDMKNG